MEKIGQYEYITEAYSLDFCGRLKFPTLFSYLLNAATKHATERGYGYLDMMKHQTTWVLSHLSLELFQQERLSEPIAISTWVERVERIFTYRCFEITALNGDVLGQARSVWAAIDVNSRRPSSLANIGLEDFIVDKPCKVKPFSKLKHAEIELNNNPINYTIKYSDLDINKHLNSMKYIEAMLDLFDLEMFENYNIIGFEIAYFAEAKHGMDLQLFKQKISNNEYITSIFNNNVMISRAKITFEKIF